MEPNATPRTNPDNSQTGCCPSFDPEGWDGAELHFENKPFVRAETRSLLHIPIDMGPVFARTFKALEEHQALDPTHALVLSRDLSLWRDEHLFAVDRQVPGQTMEYLSGDFVAKVFEGPYSQAPKWMKAMGEEVVRRGKQPGKTYFFYTTCPKCAKVFGKNHVVGVAQVV
ncbi:MAG: hypothetical protein COX57_02015 [Alphaproteobacteria bacterium CG_4_10_14_0_2_um_filter_63_37]|nr:MAG: hypothetical protein COX57_02015 [Alphaproteobacteria bacterium CG_4_10_14_0_2_um_filter_63_37]